MNRIILPFEKEVISTEEMREHIDWYVSELKEAEDKIDDKEKLMIYRTVRENLKKECKHYEKIKVEEAYINQSGRSRVYAETIKEIYRNSGRMGYTVSETIFGLKSDFDDYLKMYDHI